MSGYFDMNFIYKYFYYAVVNDGWIFRFVNWVCLIYKCLGSLQSLMKSNDMILALCRRVYWVSLMFSTAN